MALKSRNHHPPGGFSFYQPETKWSLNGGLPFEMAVDEIIRHRLANRALNLPTDRASIGNELDAYTCARIKDDEHWCEKKKTDQSYWNLPLHSPHQQQVARPAVGGASIYRRASQVLNGLPTLASWIGKGSETVPQAEADARAAICKTCPKNVRGSLAENVIGRIADAISSAVSLKNHLQLRTQLDEQLGTCDACGCHLALKVWVPGDEIKTSLTQEILDECPPPCWMRRL